MLASSSARPPSSATKATATSCWDVERFTCSCSVIISHKGRPGSKVRTSRSKADWMVCRGCDPQLLARFFMKPQCLGLLLAGLVLAQQPVGQLSQRLELLWQFDTGG